MKYYKICELKIALDSDDPGLLGNYACFEVDEIKSIDLFITTKKEKIIHKPEGDIVLDDKIQWTDVASKNMLNISIAHPDGTVNAMDVDYEWSKATITYLDNDNIWQWKTTNSLFEILFRNCLVFHNGIVLHGSAIAWEGKAIIFTAPAGTGKTTQSDLWKTHMGATVLNGDRPAIAMDENKAYVYGTPWSGSAKEYSNSRAPLSALVILEQAPENSVRQLNTFEALPKIMPRFFLPYNQKNMMNAAMSTIEKILLTTNIYLLQCTPDKRAVDVLYNALK